MYMETGRMFLLMKETEEKVKNILKNLDINLKNILLSS